MHRIKPYVLATFLSIPLIHTFALVILYGDFVHDLRSGGLKSIRTIDRPLGGAIHFQFFYGDLLKPQKYNPDIQYDLASVTCIIDSIYSQDGTLFWEYNYLLASALRESSKDDEDFRHLIANLVVSMNSNKDFVEYFVKTPEASYKIERSDWLGAKNKAYIWKARQESTYYSKYRIRYLAGLPVFSSSNAVAFIPPDVAQDRLEDNLDRVIQRLFKQIAEISDPYLNSVCFAALAASETRKDSHRYLAYRDSFHRIYASCLESDIPQSVDYIYLVIYDSLSVEEKDNAFRGAYSLYIKAKHDRSIATGIGILYMVVFLVWMKRLSIVPSFRDVTSLYRSVGVRTFMKKIKDDELTIPAMVLGANIWIIQWLFLIIPGRSMWPILIGEAILSVVGYLAVFFVWTSEVQDAERAGASGNGPFIYSK